MTDAEICRSYRNAINQSRQLQILADLTGYSRIKIITILRRNGEELPQRCIGQMYRRLDKLEEEIQRREKEYKEIAAALLTKTNEGGMGE